MPCGRARGRRPWSGRGRPTCSTRRRRATGRPQMPPFDEMLMIEPPPALRIDGATVFMPRKVPTRLMSMHPAEARRRPACSTARSRGCRRCSRARDGPEPLLGVGHRRVPLLLVGDVEVAVARPRRRARRRRPRPRRRARRRAPRTRPRRRTAAPRPRPGPRAAPGDERRPCPSEPSASRLLGADDPHGEELGAAAVGVADGRAGAVDLVLAGLAAHLHGRLGEAEHAGGADRVGRQHAAATC